MAYCRIVLATEIPQYEKIKMPVLLITGDEDKTAPPSLTQEMLDKIGAVDKEMIVLPGVGHQQGIENSEGVLDAMMHFLIKVSSA
jgi:pimeloyl-ACP methyl ester carboxylesterase